MRFLKSLHWPLLEKEYRPPSDRNQDTTSSHGLEMYNINTVYFSAEPMWKPDNKYTYTMLLYLSKRNKRLFRLPAKKSVIINSH